MKLLFTFLILIFELNHLAAQSRRNATFNKRDGTYNLPRRSSARMGVTFNVDQEESDQFQVTIDQDTARSSRTPSTQTGLFSNNIFSDMYNVTQNAEGQYDALVNPIDPEMTMKHSKIHCTYSYIQMTLQWPYLFFLMRPNSNFKDLLEKNFIIRKISPMYTETTDVEGHGRLKCTKNDFEYDEKDQDFVFIDNVGENILTASQYFPNVFHGMANDFVWDYIWDVYGICSLSVIKKIRSYFSLKY